MTAYDEQVIPQRYPATDPTFALAGFEVGIYQTRRHARDRNQQAPAGHPATLPPQVIPQVRDNAFFSAV